MSHDLSASNARSNRTWTTNQKTDAGRPSLFGSMDADVSETPDSVRILSTLNTQKPPSKRAKTRESWTRSGSHDKRVSSKTLWIMMMLGVSGTVLGIALTLHDSQTVEQRPPETTTASASVSQPASSLNSLVQADARKPDSAPDVARIEEISSATTTQSPADEISAQAILATSPTPVTTAAMPVASPPSAPARTTTPIKAATTAALNKANSKRDADVALIEAMFVHTKPPAKQRAAPHPNPANR